MPEDLQHKQFAPYVPKKGEEYMSDRQLAHFRNILETLKAELMQDIERTVHTMQGSNERTMCCTATGEVSPASTGAPTSAASSAPGVPAWSRGEKFQPVGATIW